MLELHAMCTQKIQSGCGHQDTDTKADQRVGATARCFRMTSTKHDLPCRVEFNNPKCCSPTKDAAEVVVVELSPVAWGYHRVDGDRQTCGSYRIRRDMVAGL